MASNIHSIAGTKRLRENDDDGAGSGLGSPFGKKIRPTLNATPTDAAPWNLHDSVLGTPTKSSQHQQAYVSSQKAYDSDDQSSMISEPGSPQDFDATSSSNGDDMDMNVDDATTFSQSPDDQSALSRAGNSSPWREQQQQRSTRTRTRIATPFATHTQLRNQASRQAPGAGVSRGGFIHHLQTNNPSTRSPSQHIRQRHPQENLSGISEVQQRQTQLLEVPSPIDEDEVPTPPSAAEAAGSQLSMLSVSDIMDIESVDVPAITLHPSRRSTQLDGTQTTDGHGLVGYDSSNGTAFDGGLLVRKQRLRSGAQSHGSSSPVGGARFGHVADENGGLVKKGLSMGFRADCEKCRLRVPGHMNHFVL